MQSMAVCLSAVQLKHSTAIFSDVGLQREWPARLQELLLVPVAKDDGLPPQICRSCAGKVESQERKMKALRQLAKESANSFQATQACETRKRR